MHPQLIQFCVVINGTLIDYDNSRLGLLNLQTSRTVPLPELFYLCLDFLGLDQKLELIAVTCLGGLELKITDDI